jgi:hypothetical protein
MSAPPKPPPLPPSPSEATAATGSDAPTTVYEPAPKPAKPPRAKDESQQETPAESTESDESGSRRGFFHLPRFFLETTSAFFTSTVFHLAILIALAITFLPEKPTSIVPILEAIPIDLNEDEERLVDEFLDESLTPSLNQAVAIVSSNAMAAGDAGVVVGGVGVGGVGVGDVGPPAVELVSQGVKLDVDVNADDPLLNTPPARVLIQFAPEGMRGDERAIVNDYAEAMDLLTQELLLQLERRNLLVIWCFDQSESMKDDQEEIRNRIERVYAEMGLTGRTSGGVMTTAVTSYGKGFAVHTEKPTANIDVIKRAIHSVPSDPTGKEMMCSALTQSMALHRQAAKGRQMILILVTDETGEKEDNVLRLEGAIAEAKANNCKCYVLGREAVFGYPYAHMSWQHPGTGEVHWLPVDRGPETGLIEQLQTNGFHRRYDSFNSGFGPYEQTRLVRETGGVFFMLPSVELNLVGGEKRRYELEAMRSYRPDLRSRAELVQENLSSLLRTRINEVIGSLNPWNEAVRPHIELQVHFSPNPQDFIKQAVEARAKSVRYVQYLDLAEKVFDSDEMKYARRQETSPRWQANYDLLFAQILAYKVRNFEYAAYLDWFLKNPKVVPLTQSPNLLLVHWDITTRKETLTGELTAAYIERSKELFQKVIENHPGTPWAARAEWELQRGFGVELVPAYRAPYRTYTGPVIPIPNL